MKFNHLVLFFFSNLIFSQADLINAEKPSDAENNEMNSVKTLQYEKINENDILWSKVVYEYIDLNEKLNFPFLFPTDDAVNKIGRKSLWRVIKEHIVNKLNSSDTLDLEIYSEDNFSKSEKLTAKETLDQMSWEFPNRKLRTMEREYIPSNSIGGYNIKGIWYFDKKLSQLKYRLLGIQPVSASINALKDEVPDPELTSTVFWIWYPSIRKELNQNLVFNDRNNNNRISFDALLVNRRFSSYIYKYDNVYGDRTIKQYIRKRPNESPRQHKLRLLMESERIKKEILDFEVDMWGY